MSTTHLYHHWRDSRATDANHHRHRNLIASKAFFFFGSESVEADVLAAYKRAEKHAEVAQHNIAWAAHTGKGLLFIGDKKAPHGVINLVSNHRKIVEQHVSIRERLTLEYVV